MLNRWNGRPILPLIPNLIIETDASLLGWGVATTEMSTGDLWLEQERAHHINLYIGASRWSSGYKDFHKENAEHPCPPQNGQHDCHSLYKPDGGHEVPDPLPSSL